MKRSALLRGGIAGGIIAALMLTAAGRLLAVSMPPWSWTSMSIGMLGRTIEWIRTALVLLPFGIVGGIVEAFVCAVVFEYVTQRAGALIGAIVGLLIGMIGTAVVGLLPWLAYWFAYTYTPSDAPLGPYDPSWALVTLVGVGLVAGAAAGACYGRPLRALRTPAVVRWREIDLAARRRKLGGDGTR